MRPRVRFLRRALLAALAASTLPGSGAAQFEGIIESSNRSADEWGKLQAYQMTIWIKGDKARVHTTANASTPASTLISRGDRGVVWILDDAARTYLEMRRIQERETMPDGETSLTVKRTGKTKKVLGYAAEQVLLTSGEVETEIWGTRELKKLAESLAASLGGRRGISESGWHTELERLGLYPLVARTKLNGVLMESAEVTKIAPSPVPPETFELPPGYRKEKVQLETP